MNKLVTVLLLVVMAGALPGAVAGCHRSADNQTITEPTAGEHADFQTVTASELTANWTAYYGRKVALTGTFNKPWGAVPACEPQGGDNPYIVEKYGPYRAGPYMVDWVAFKVMATTQQGTRYETTLPAEEGQTITVRGVVEPATVQDFCNLDKFYRSLYIVADYNDITLD